mgnify:CR=1 FL=1
MTTDLSTAVRGNVILEKHNVSGHDNYYTHQLERIDVYSTAGADDSNLYGAVYPGHRVFWRHTTAYAGKALPDRVRKFEYEYTDYNEAMISFGNHRDYLLMLLHDPLDKRSLI